MVLVWFGCLSRAVGLLYVTTVLLISGLHAGRTQIQLCNVQQINCTTIAFQSRLTDRHTGGDYDGARDIQFDASDIVKYLVFNLRSKTHAFCSGGILHSVVTVKRIRNSACQADFPAFANFSRKKIAI